MLYLYNLQASSQWLKSANFFFVINTPPLPQFRNPEPITDFIPPDTQVLDQIIAENEKCPEACMMGSIRERIKVSATPPLTSQPPDEKLKQFLSTHVFS